MPVPLQTRALTAAVDGDVTDNAGEERIEIGPRFVGRNQIPGLQIGIVLAFLGGGKVRGDAEGQRAQAGTVFFRRALYGGFIPVQIEPDNLLVFQKP